MMMVFDDPKTGLGGNDFSYLYRRRTAREILEIFWYGRSMQYTKKPLAHRCCANGLGSVGCGPGFKGPYGRYLLRIKEAFVPPKPNELLMAYSTSAWRAWLGM
jgi:hypothetical protein